MNEQEWKARIEQVSAPLERAATAEPGKGLASNIAMIDRGALIDALMLLRDGWFVALGKGS